MKSLKERFGKLSKKSIIILVILVIIFLLICILSLCGIAGGLANLANRAGDNRADVSPTPTKGVDFTITPTDTTTPTSDTPAPTTYKPTVVPTTKKPTSTPTPTPSPTVNGIPYKTFVGHVDSSFTFNYSKNLPDATYQIPLAGMETITIGAITVEYNPMGGGSGDVTLVEQYNLTNASGYTFQVTIVRLNSDPNRVNITAKNTNGPKSVSVFAAITEAQRTTYKGYVNFIVQSMRY